MNILRFYSFEAHKRSQSSAEFRESQCGYFCWKLDNKNSLLTVRESKNKVTYTFVLNEINFEFPVLYIHTFIWNVFPVKFYFLGCYAILTLSHTYSVFTSLTLTSVNCPYSKILIIKQLLFDSGKWPIFVYPEMNFIKYECVAKYVFLNTVMSLS